MASLELVDHTQDLKSWYLPQQQHGAQQPPIEVGSVERASAQKQTQQRLTRKS